MRVPGGEPAGDSAGLTGSDTEQRAEGEGEREGLRGDVLEQSAAMLAEWRLLRRISSLMAIMERFTHMRMLRVRMSSVKSNAVSKCGIQCGCGTLSKHRKS